MILAHIDQALVNTPKYGMEDFPGVDDLRGRTFSLSGPAVSVQVFKCPKCGHSVGAGRDDNG